MSSQHAHDAHHFRPDANEFEPAKDELKKRGRHMTAFLRACLRMFNARPDEMLALLAPFWPEPRLLGNPERRRKSTDDSDAA